VQSLGFDKFEVIVINNNCTDNTEALVSEFIQNLDIPLTIRQVIEKRQGLSFARNRGIKEAKGDIIMYVDDDGEAEYNVLERLLNHFEKNPDWVGIGGKVIPQYETQEPTWLSYHVRMLVTHIDYGDSIFKCYGKRYPPGCNMSYRKDILIKAGGFNNALKWRVDDKYIFEAVNKLTDNIFYVPDLVVWHNIDADRITDKNFDKLSLLLGKEERLRVFSIGESVFIKKIEYFLKYLATYVLSLKFIFKGEFIKAKYLIRHRKQAFLGLFIQK
jgi:glycosyltransferase involved in cell wall biosynthesis